jgi:hypothetical protein
MKSSSSVKTWQCTFSGNVKDKLEMNLVASGRKIDPD